MKVSQTLTITANTPLNAYSGLSAAAMASAGWTSSFAPAASTFFVPTFLVKRIFVQMLPGGSGIGYVLLGSPGQAPAHGTNGQMLAELAPSPSATTPGGTYADGDSNENCIDVSQIWIDGSHSGDTVLVTYEV